MIRGINTGGDKADYYDNPNYDPKNEGKSKTDKKISNLNEASDRYTYAYNYETENVGPDTDLSSGGTLKYEEDAIDAAGESLDSQTKSTVSYFRDKDRGRLNVDNPNAGASQVNPDFSKPASLENKLSKFGLQVDPEEPYNILEPYDFNKEPIKSNQIFDTSRGYLIEETYQWDKGNPMPNTVAGVNQELQARKARTRDFAMEFRGTIYDFIDATRENLKAETSDIVAEYQGTEIESKVFNDQELENRFFPDEASKKAAKTELTKMISFTDEASDISREYSNLTQYAETIVGDTKDTPRAILDHGIRGPIGEKKWVNEKLTSQNYEKSVKAFSDWKSKKGVPKIVRLISKLG